MVNKYHAAKLPLRNKRKGRVYKLETQIKKTKNKIKMNKMKMHRNSGKGKFYA